MLPSLPAARCPLTMPTDCPSLFAVCVLVYIYFLVFILFWFDLCVENLTTFIFVFSSMRAAWPRPVNSQKVIKILWLLVVCVKIFKLFLLFFFLDCILSLALSHSVSISLSLSDCWAWHVLNAFIVFALYSLRVSILLEKKNFNICCSSTFECPKIIIVIHFAPNVDLLHIEFCSIYSFLYVCWCAYCFWFDLISK